MCVFQFEMYKAADYRKTLLDDEAKAQKLISVKRTTSTWNAQTADFHSNLFVSWELVTEGCKGRPVKCAHGNSLVFLVKHHAKDKGNSCAREKKFYSSTIHLNFYYQMSLAIHRQHFMTVTEPLFTHCVIVVATFEFLFEIQAELPILPNFPAKFCQN